MSTVNKEDLVRIGYKPYTAQRIIREAKALLIDKGYPLYRNKRLGRVPKEAVEEIIGCELEFEQGVNECLRTTI